MRPRPTYPSLKPGEGWLGQREECGTGIEHLPTARAQERDPKVLFGEFVYERALIPPRRSKYEPHVGKKEATRKETAA